MPPGEKSTLHVEGPDDRHVIEHLLRRHEVDLSHVAIRESDGKDALLRAVNTVVRAGTGLSVGFVLDADQVVRSRWQAVRDRLAGVGLSLPQTIPKQGFVGDATEYRTRVGVWLMPDNQRGGTLEEFLQDLVDEDDPLFPHAQASTERAGEMGARFSEGDRGKAVMHAWLAWQERPGLPYGSAISAHFFRHESNASSAFVKWFGNLFS